MDPTIQSLLEAIGLATFIWYLFRSLSQQVSGLKELVAAQKQTIEVMERRNAETEKIGGLYKTLLSDLPTDLENYKKIVSTTKDSTILELQNKHAATEQQLKKVQDEMQRAGTSLVPVTSQLAALRVLLLGRSDTEGEEELNLRKISENVYKYVDQAIPAIQEATSVERFLEKAVGRLVVEEDASLIRDAFKNGLLLDGTPITYSYTKYPSLDQHRLWFALTPTAVFMNQRMLLVLQREFFAVKNAA